MDNTSTKVSHLSAARAANQATIAWVAGEEIQQLPKDLYIPPEALEVFRNLRDHSTYCST